ncbi:MAG: hypothetical protein ACXAAH_02805 [Promethearchaeota archaeon]
MNSIEMTAANPYDIEVLVQIDEDDEESIAFFNEENSYSFILRSFIADRPKNLHTSINNLAKNTNGDFLFVLNDDTQFTTYGWDNSIKHIDSKDIWYLRTKDNSCDKVHDKLYSSFPILTRGAYKALGYFMSEKFVGLGADAHLWRLFKGVDRVKETDVNIDHIFHRTVEDVMNPDNTAQYMRNNTWSNNVDPWSIDMTEEIHNLLNKIEGR